MIVHNLFILWYLSSSNPRSCHKNQNQDSTKDFLEGEGAAVCLCKRLIERRYFIECHLFILFRHVGLVSTNTSKSIWNQKLLKAGEELWGCKCEHSCSMLPVNPMKMSNMTLLLSSHLCKIKWHRLTSSAKDAAICFLFLKYSHLWLFQLLLMKYTIEGV